MAAAMVWLPCMYQGHQVMRSSFQRQGPWYLRL